MTGRQKTNTHTQKRTHIKMPKTPVKRTIVTTTTKGLIPISSPSAGVQAGSETAAATQNNNNGNWNELEFLFCWPSLK